MAAIKLYRIANKLYRMQIPILPYLFYRMIYVLNNCHIHYSTDIGAGTTIAYGGIGVVIHKDSVIGKSCVIASNVTIGGRSNIPVLPKIGDNVYVGTGARILGDVTIGNNVIVGANAVVIQNVPPNCIVAGIPSKIIKKNININEKCNLEQIVEGNS